MSDNDIIYITKRDAKIEPQRGYSTSAAAAYIGVSNNTLYEITAQGHLHPREMRGRRVYLKEDLDRYLDSLKPYRGHPREVG